MAGSPILHLNTQFAIEQAQRIEAKKKISDVLKHVDQLIRKGDLDFAQIEIFKAKELDPTNGYTLALEERIHNLKAEIERAENIKQKEDSLEKINVTVNTVPEIKQTMAPAIKETPINIKTNSSTNNKLPSIAPTTAAAVSASIESEKQNNQAHNRKIELDTYRKALMDAWYDGFLSEAETRQLKELRTLLEVTESEHNQIENYVRRECYKNAIAHYFSDKTSIEINDKAFVELRHKFRISEEDHKQIEAHLTNKKQPQQRDRVLVVDDDTRLLELLQTSLEDNGFEVFALPTSDEAFALLRKFTPDLILCDINLETSTMGGFTFYEKIQELKNIQNVPFVFLTGLTDEALVRTGKELGVDDFLMKPISERMLISAIRGKLKRFKQLKKFTQPVKTTAIAS